MSSLLTLNTEQIPVDKLITRELLADVRRLAWSISFRTGGAVDADELFSAGECVLPAEAARFDQSRGVEFKWAAMPRVRGAMLDYLRSIDPMSRYGRQRLKQLEAKLGTAEPDAEELKVLSSRQRIVSLDAAEHPDAVISYAARSNGTGVTDRLRLDESLLVPAIQRLEPVEQLVIWQTCVAGVADKRVGVFIGGLTGSRVQQIRKEALKKLRAFFLRLNAPLPIYPRQS